ncbi:MAG: cyclic nucleotide-binding domain-containing protein [Nitrospirae bacterium]|nr:cyclic nucleotide-binding domain-containing protein [Nitrospirota bacterium]
MITEYFEGLRSGKDKKEAIMYMATKCALPITLTTATTVFGFSSLAFNKITILKQFGIVTTFGLSINFLITIIVIPSFLQFMNVPGIFQKKKRNPLKRHIDSFIDWFIKLPTQHKTLITVGTLFCIGLALAGCFRLKVNTDFISYFKEGSYIRQRVASIHKDLSGALNFNIIVEAGEEDKIKDPHVLKQIAGLQQYMDGLKVMDKSISIADYIKVMNREMHGGEKEMQKVPDSKNLVTHFMARYYKELKNTNDQQLAVVNSLKGEGEPVLLSSVALAVGFAILGMSEFNPTIHFGLLSALVMLIGFASEMLVTPILLGAVQLITLWDFLLLKLKRDITKESPLFMNLSRSEAKKVVLLGSIRSASQNEYIIRQGERGEEMYMIVTGKVKVTVDSEGKSKELGTLKGGDIVGEMALVGGGTRSANVIALEDTELLRIDDKSLDRVRRRFPRIAAKLFLNISRVLSNRLKTQNYANF